MIANTSVVGESPPDGACVALVSAPLPAEEADRVARSFKALSDPTRLRILSIVASHPDREACVCDLQQPLGLAQPTVSHHLRILSEAGFLTRSKRGTWAYYALVPGSLERLAGVLFPS